MGHKSHWDKKKSRTLEGSEAFYDNAGEARAMWDKGFRPMPANELKPGMRVVAVTTDVFQLNRDPSKKWFTTLIGDVMDDEMGTITCSTLDSGNIETDELSEVWAK